MIYITGDTHTPIDISKLNTAKFPDQKTLSKSDYVIVCGDFGGVWDYSEEGRYWLDWFEKKSFSTLFVDGNHENFDMLSDYPLEDFLGGKVHRIKKSVYHLMRGQVFNIDGSKFFTMGGASSRDKEFREEGVSWWPEEMPSKEEYTEAVRNLEKHGNAVDYIITHCAADSIQREIDVTTHYGTNMLTDFLEAIKNKVSYKHWYFGHYHEDIEIDDKHTCVYYKIIKPDKG